MEKVELEGFYMFDILVCELMDQGEGGFEDLDLIDIFVFVGI